MSETMQLTVIQASTLPTILAADSNDILGKLAAELSDFEADVTTVKGRAEIASKAHKVATAKMDLIRLGKSLTEGWREQTKAVNAECAVIEERMNKLRDQVRAPLDEYQDRERRRVEGHEARLARIDVMTRSVDDTFSSAQIADLIDQLADIGDPSYSWEEFEAKADKAINQTAHLLRLAYQHAKSREDEAEAARIAAEEQAKREREAAVLAQIAREERIAAEAAEAARLAAEVEAARKAREAEERAQAQLAAAEAMRKHQAEEAARKEREVAEALRQAEMRERETAERMERARIVRFERSIAEIEQAAYYPGTPSSASVQARIDAVCSGWGGKDFDWQEFVGKAAKARADTINVLSEIRNAAIEREDQAGRERERVIRERERLSAEQAEAAKEAAARQAEREKLAAVEAERKRVAAEAERQRIVDEERAANRAHRTKINREIVEDLLLVMRDKWDIEDLTPEELAREIVVALAKGLVRHTKVQY
jgi:colicin import membrane protein